MPELPDVQVFKEYVDATSLHRRVEDVRVEDGRELRDVSAPALASRLRGRELDSTRRHGRPGAVRPRSPGGAGRVLRKALEVRVDADRMPRSWLLPRREEGRDCPRCGGTIQKTEVSGRATYLCSGHQRPQD